MLLKYWVKIAFVLATNVVLGAGVFDPDYLLAYLGLAESLFDFPGLQELMGMLESSS